MSVKYISPSGSAGPHKEAESTCAFGDKVSLVYVRDYLSTAPNPLSLASVSMMDNQNKGVAILDPKP